jgi:hypothetical protein
MSDQTDLTFGDIEGRRLERVQVGGSRWHRVELGTFRLAAGLSLYDPGAIVTFTDTDDGREYAANVEDLTAIEGDLVAWRHAPLPDAGALDFDLPGPGRLTVAAPETMHPDALERLRVRVVGHGPHGRGRAAFEVLVDAGVSIEVAGLPVQRPGESVGSWLGRMPAGTVAHPATPEEFQLVHEVRVALASPAAFAFAWATYGEAPRPVA